MQHRLSKILLPLLAAWTFGVSCSPAQAESWEPAAISADHDSWLFIDWASLKRSKTLVTVRIMTEYYEDQPGRPETNYLAYVAIRNLVRFDCAGRRVQALEEEYLDSEEGFLGGKEVSRENWEPVVSGSLIEAAFGRVCKTGKPIELSEQEGRHPA